MRYNVRKTDKIKTKIDILTQLGENVRRIRKEKALSQIQLAYLSELERAYISFVETGRRDIRISTLEKIAIGLNVKISELF